ncbi:MAG: restriction endonuclease subunit S [Pseudoalteromonas distincta]|uniref:restriction endonuclease subunit S n=1 Tax=Pseudoalteromonas distincta TaxID=77608 RepID=UPI003F95466C
MGDIKNIPELNFGLSSTEWNEFELGKITLSYSGGTPQSENPVYYGGDIPFIRSGEISSDLTSLHITQAALENSSAKLVEKGDILYALYGATSGEVSRSQIDGAINQAVMAIKPDEGFDFEFITQLLRKNKKKIINTFLQGGQGNLSGAIIKSLVFKFPEKTKQTQIGTFFKNLDNQITLKQRKLDKLVTLKKAMLEKMFPKEGADEPEIRFKGFTGAWLDKSFGQMATFFNGRAYKQEELLSTGKYRVLRVGNFFSNNQWYFSDLELESNKYCDNGDLLYAWSASFGPRIWHGEKVIYHYHIWKVVENDGIDRQFLHLLLDFETENMKSNSANGMGLLHITKGTIEGWECSYPENIGEQKAIGFYFKKLDDLISLQKTELTKLKQIKSSCLEKMFV